MGLLKNILELVDNNVELQAEEIRASLNVPTKWDRKSGKFYYRKDGKEETFGRERKMARRVKRMTRRAVEKEMALYASRLGSIDGFSDKSLGKMIREL